MEEYERVLSGVRFLNQRRYFRIRAKQTESRNLPLVKLLADRSARLAQKAHSLLRSRVTTCETINKERQSNGSSRSLFLTTNLWLMFSGFRDREAGCVTFLILVTESPALGARAREAWEQEPEAWEEMGQSAAAACPRQMRSYPARFRQRASSSSHPSEPSAAVRSAGGLPSTYPLHAGTPFRA